MAAELVTQPNDVRGALARCNVLRVMQNNRNKAQIDAYITSLGLTIQSSRYFDGDAVTPQCYAFVSEGTLKVFVSGVSTAAMGQLIWNFYTGPHGAVNVFGAGFSQITPQQAAASVFTNVVNGQFPWSAIHATGYSWGGVVMQQLLALLAGAISPQTFSGLTTIGSPKPFVQPDQGLQQWTSIYSWFNEDDAVPLIPPDITTLQRMLAGLSVGQGRRLASFQRWESGISITQTGLIIPSPTPTANPIPQATQVGNWLAQTEAGIQTPHSIPVYVARLTLAVANTPVPQAVINVPSQPGLSHSVTATAVARQQVGFQQTVFTDATRQNSTPVVVPSSNVFFAARTGRIWYVYFGGVQIAMAPKKRRARALANLGNAWLRKLQNEAVVNAADLSSQFTSYLQAASDPLGGFEPVMNVTP
jgi:hypothetical protein